MLVDWDLRLAIARQQRRGARPRRRSDMDGGGFCLKIRMLAAR
jgi:hypothetical protein